MPVRGDSPGDGASGCNSAEHGASAAAQRSDSMGESSSSPTGSSHATMRCNRERCGVVGEAIWAEFYRACCVKWDHQSQMHLLAPRSGYSEAMQRTRSLPRAWRRGIHWLSQVIRCGAACTVSGPCVDFLYCKAHTGRLSMWLGSILFSLFMPWLMLFVVYLQNVCTLFI